MRHSTYLIIIFMLVSYSGIAQHFVTGKILRAESQEFLVSVSIQNKTQHRFDLSDERGAYRIQAATSDVIIISHVGYRADTLVVDSAMLSGNYDIFLEPRASTLQAVRVGALSNYQLDSTARRQEYSWLYDRGKQPAFEHNRTGDGVGINMNIFRHTTGADKDRELLLKRIVREEEEYYIDFRYSRDYVSRLTHLKGDSLQAFMEHYRPTYDYCRKAANVDILVFINDSYKQFMKGGW